MQAFNLNYVWKNDENFSVQFLFFFLHAYKSYIRNAQLDSQDVKCCCLCKEKYLQIFI